MLKSKGLEGISLTSYDELFQSGEQAATGEQVREIPLAELFPFKNHPFKVLDDDTMQETSDSVK